MLAVSASHCWPDYAINMQYSVILRAYVPLSRRLIKAAKRSRQGVAHRRLQVSTAQCASCSTACLHCAQLSPPGCQLTVLLCAQRLHADVCALGSSIAMLNPMLVQELSAALEYVPPHGTAYQHLVRGSPEVIRQVHRVHQC